MQMKHKPKKGSGLGAGEGKYVRVGLKLEDLVNYLYQQNLPQPLCLPITHLSICLFPLLQEKGFYFIL